MQKKNYKLQILYSLCVIAVTTLLLIISQSFHNLPPNLLKSNDNYITHNATVAESLGVDYNYFRNTFIQFLDDSDNIAIDYDTIKIKELYDNDDSTDFIMAYSEDNGYMISNIITATSYEKCSSGNSPYYEYLNAKCYYFGYGNYYYDNNGKITATIGTSNELDKDLFNRMHNELTNIKTMDLSENGEKNYYSRTSVSDRVNNSRYISTAGKNYFTKKWSTDGYYNMGNNKYDYLLPKNNDTSCGIVASVQLMQYLDRNGIADTTTAFINSGKNIIYDKIKGEFHTKCLTQMMHDELDSMTWSGAFGENYTNNLITGMNKFFDKYPPTMKVWVTPNPGLPGYYQTAKAKFKFHHNSFYDNMMGQINSGKPAIGLTSIGNGYYQNSGGNWTSSSVARHIMLVYGYCTTDKGTLKDFITHSGWRVTGTEKMYVYKLNFLGNLTYDLTHEPFIIM